MAEQHYGTDHAGGDHAGPSFQTYMNVFYVLCVLTAVSFICNWLAGRDYISTTTSVSIIVMVAVVKALFVVAIFMHVKFDWGKLYCIIVPVSILAVMMVIVLLPDTVLGWRREAAETPAKIHAVEQKKID